MAQHEGDVHLSDRNEKRREYIPLDRPCRIIAFEEAREQLLNQYHADLGFQIDRIRDFPIRFYGKPDAAEEEPALKYSVTEVLMPDRSSLSKEFIQKNADYQYITHDQRTKVWVWHQVVLIEVTGDWTSEVVSDHLRTLLNDFYTIRRYWKKAFAVIDCDRLTIQTEAFRYQLKTDWEKLFKRNDLLICLIENNTLRRIIRQSIIKPVPGRKNVRIFKEYKEAFRRVTFQMLLEETDVRR